MEAMQAMPDKAFDLAVIDPPYGGGGVICGCRASAPDFGGWFDRYEIKATRTGGGYAEKYGKSIEHWDVAPPPEYFKELFRVSKNQIIWGGNYFELPATRCFLVWRKLTISEGFTMAMCEYAWTSFNDNAKWIELAPQGKRGEQRFHPTQKPVELYRWILHHYAKPGDRILDTHLGSGSSRIAAHDLGFDFVGYEIDKDYFDAQEKRFAAYTAQGSLFTEETPGGISYWSML